MNPNETGRGGVSYLLTTRNRCAFVEERIHNVREFIRPCDEFLVFDGGSTDGTAEMVARHRDVVTQFVSEPDRGEAHGFNKAILASRGEVIKVLTDDDHFYPDAMRRAVEVMEADAGVDALVCGGEAFMGSGEDERFWLNFRLPSGASRVDLQAVFRYLNCGLGLFFRRRIIPLAGLFDTTFAAVDTQYLSQIVRCGLNLRYLDVCLFKHTRHPHSTSANEGRIQRDIVRVLLDAGELDYLLSEGRSYLKHAPGVGKLRYGGAYLTVLTALRRLEESRAAWCLALVSGAVGGARRVVRNLRALVGAKRGAGSGPGPAAAEQPAAWTGVLR